MRNLLYLEKNELKPGMGLGLYIAKNIVTLNDMNLDYKFENNMHQFINRYG